MPTALARAYALQFRWTDLEDVLAKAERNDSDDSERFYRRAETWLAPIGFPQAAAEVEKARQIKPNFEQARKT